MIVAGSILASNSIGLLLTPTIDVFNHFVALTATV